MELIEQTIALARRNVDDGGRPFACIIARGDEVLAASPNLVAQTHDPTAHAEVVAIREACRKLGTEHLVGCDVYVMAHPCPMCLGALYYASPDRVLFLTTRAAYSHHYTDDRKYFTLSTFYEEFSKPWQSRNLPMIHVEDERALDVYRRWEALNDASKHAGRRGADTVPTTLVSEP
ncbi:Cytidine and deoxycytidylate deaminase zinc-binding region [Sinosporangium album]|uniref:Cytidine and deoxycytidylate deaminase zinc-binding region n=1 Tax=Sinosporangium album TaxID=504805 RepID=A0A1G8BJJ8_9ACTN|nr:nucleoside deaminase [Sinosporangium album]SDH33311.1 Cytidine and deoxycytidylate deaminase zinc-binding region [Sinosporangium album]